MPRRDGQDARGHGRPDRERERHHHRVHAHAAPQPVRREHEADQRDVDAHDGRAADALQDAGGDERGEGVGQAAHQRGGREKQGAGREHAPVPEDLARGRERQQHGDHGQLIGVDHPDHLGLVHAQAVGDGGQRGVGDRGVQRGHRHREQDRGQRQRVAPTGQAVGDGNAGGGGYGGHRWVASWKMRAPSHFTTMRMSGRRDGPLRAFDAILPDRRPAFRI